MQFSMVSNTWTKEKLARHIGSVRDEKWSVLDFQFLMSNHKNQNMIDLHHHDHSSKDFNNLCQSENTEAAPP